MCFNLNTQNYLSDEEFSTVFGMTRAQWEVLPNWQKPGKKKEAKLF